MPLDPIPNAFANSEFRREFSEALDDKLLPITRLLEHHDRQLREHEAALQRARGAKWAFITVWSLVIGAIEWFAHSGHR